MPDPSGPPPRGKLVAGTVTALANGSYDSSSGGFIFQQTTYKLTIQRQSGTNDTVEWIHSTSGEASKYANPQAKMSSATWDVVHGGTYDAQTATYDYENKTWEIRVGAVSGGLVAVAVSI